MSMCAVGRERDVREGICDLMWQIWKHEMVVMYVCTNTELAILLCVLRAIWLSCNTHRAQSLFCSDY